MHIYCGSSRTECVQRTAPARVSGYRISSTSEENLFTSFVTRSPSSLDSMACTDCWSVINESVNARKLQFLYLIMLFAVVSMACLAASVFSFDGTTRDVKLIPWLITKTSPYDYYGLVGYILNGSPYLSYNSPTCTQYFCYDCQDAGTVSFALNLTALTLASCFLPFALLRAHNNTRHLQWINAALALLSSICSGTSYSYFHTVCHQPLLDAGHTNIIHGHGMNLTLTGFAFMFFALVLTGIIHPEDMDGEKT